MPGLWGFVQRHPGAGPDPEAVSREMLAGVVTRHPATRRVSSGPSWHITSIHFQSTMVWPEDPPPVAGPEVVLDGYLVNRDEVICELSQRDVSADPQWHDEVLAGLLYRTLGAEALPLMVGSYNLCVLEDEGHGCRLISCPAGSRHLYYTVTEEYVAFASETKALLAIPGIQRKANRLALQDYFNFAYLSGDNTLVDGVKLLRGGTTVSVSGAEVESSTYWRFEFRNEQSSATLVDLVDEGARRYDRALERLAARFGSWAVPLSGGLDSRTILAFGSRIRDELPVYHCAWYRREERIARDICQAHGARWHGYDPLSFDYARVLQEGFAISDGNAHCHQYWFLPLAQDMAAKGNADVILDGYLMDVFFGDTFLVLPERSAYSDEDRRDIVNRLWRRCRPRFVKGAFLPEFYEEYEDANRTSIRLQAQGIHDEDLSNWVHRFSFHNRSNRFSVALPNVQRQLVEYAYPGTDPELVDLYLQVPPRLKKGAALARGILTTHAPKAAAVPWAKTGRPLASDKGILDRCFDRLPLRQVGTLAGLAVSGGRLDLSHHGDLNRHFRRNRSFRRAHLDLLYDERTWSRGIIDRSGLDRLVGYVDRGWPVISLLQSLVTVELFHRRFMDG
ncbi:asparagine synthase-related protein [Candidatus Latescibacterota bacterium]